MKDLVIDAILAIESNSNWNKNQLSRDEIYQLGIEQLREYAFDISRRFTDLGLELSRVCVAYKTLIKYQTVK